MYILKVILMHLLFLTTNNFETQFGREVVYQIELILNNEFKKKATEFKKNNQNLNVWQWQHYTFEKIFWIL